jgi:NAD(P)-dependent dehydrogenase (short-subunit alcohol dehydrogenase family)
MPNGGSASGTVVAITGAGRGIGRGLALAFARHGARAVVVSDIDAAAAVVAEQVRAAGAEAVAVHADVTRAADCAAMVDQAMRAWGRPAARSSRWRRLRGAAAPGPSPR